MLKKRFPLFAVWLLVLVLPTFAQKNRNPPACTVPAPPTTDTKCYFGSGCLDSSFGTQGIALAPFGPELVPGSIETVLVQPDGKLVLIGFGTVNGPTGGDLLIARLNTDGTPDTMFGDVDISNPLQKSGYTLVDFSGGGEFSGDGVLLPDGKILAGGKWSAANGYVRLNDDGSVDETFGTNGKVVLQSLSLDDVALQSDGTGYKIILAGGGSNFVAVRLHPSGELDGSFGAGGIASANPSSARGSGLGRTVALQPVPDSAGPERIVVGGWLRDKTNGPIRFALVRFTPSGSLDTSFGSGGRTSTAFTEGTSQIFDIAVDADGKIVAAGLVNASCGGINHAFARFGANGSLDNTFSGDGRLTLDVYGGDDRAMAATLHADGKIVVSGFARPANSLPAAQDVALIRLLSDGTLDQTFGIGLAGYFGPGIVTTDIGTGSAWGLSVAIQADDKIVVAGAASNGGSNLAVARYLP